MCGCIGNCILARAPIRPNSAWKAFGVIGPSRSVIKTCEDGPCSRCRRRSARISSPCIGWTLGEPFFALRTWSRPVASSTCDPLQIAQLGRPQAVAIADQDHGCVPMAVAAGLPGGARILSRIPVGVQLHDFLLSMDGDASTAGTLKLKLHWHRQKADPLFRSR